MRQFADAFAKLLQATHRGGEPPERDPMDRLKIRLFKELSRERHPLDDRLVT